MVSACIAIIGLSTACANDPVSQKRIQQRNEARARTIERMKRSEARHPAKLDYRMRDISRDHQRKKVEFQETMRTLGDRFW